METEHQKLFRERGGKKPWFPPISFGIMPFGLIMLMLATIVGRGISVWFTIGAGLCFGVVLALSLWSECQYRKYGISITD